jgi:pimeloyl-ACP methyl ester carboxylesterase
MRDQVIEQVGSELGGRTRRSPGSWATKQIFELALTLGAMDHIQRKRGALTDATYPFAGDILLYQARGKKIRAFIGEQVRQAKPPVVLLGHSLGGIACADLLVEQELSQVQLLITVGSQVPFFYEINALQCLAWQTSLPPHFPPSWLNIYDLRDFLSYVGTKLFPGKVEDKRVDSKQPFPHAHSAYFTNPQTWEAIVPLIP